MAAGCGLRWGECTGLPWDAVDVDDAEVHVRQVVVELSGRLDLRPYPKARAGRRTVPMPEFVVAALRGSPGRSTAGRACVRHEDRHPAAAVQLPPAGVAASGGALRAAGRIALVDS